MGKRGPKGKGGRRALATEQISKYRSWRLPFLAVLRKTGIVLLACQSAHISRSVAYKLHDTNKSFRLQWAEAMEEAIEILEAEARRRALTISDTMMIFLLKAHRPEKYRDVYRVEHSLVREEVRRLALASGLAEEDIMRETENILGVKVG